MTRSEVSVRGKRIAVLIFLLFPLVLWAQDIPPLELPDVPVVEPKLKAESKEGGVSNITPLSLPDVPIKSTPTPQTQKPMAFAALSLPNISPRQPTADMGLASRDIPNLSLPNVTSTYKELRLSDFSGGLNQRDFPTEIADNELSELTNFVWEGNRWIPRDGFTTYYAMSEVGTDNRVFGLFRHYEQGGGKILYLGQNDSLFADTLTNGTFLTLKTDRAANDKYYYFNSFKDKAIVAHEDDYPLFLDGHTEDNLKFGFIDSFELDYTNSGLSDARLGLIATDKIWVADELVGYFVCVNTSPQTENVSPRPRRIFSNDTTEVTLRNYLINGGYSNGQQIYIFGLFDYDSVATVKIDSIDTCATASACTAALVMYGTSWPSITDIDSVTHVIRGLTGEATGIERTIDGYWTDYDSIFMYSNFHTPGGSNWPVANDSFLILKKVFWKPKICEVYKNRVFFVTENNWPSGNEFVVFSNNNNATGFDQDNYFTIKTEDGDHIVAMATFYDDQLGYKDDSKDCLVFFKQNSIWKLVWNSSTDYYLVQVVDGIGCVAPKTVKSIEGKFILFLHTTGVYAFDGRTVKLVSDKVKPILETINKTQYHQIVAGYYDRHYYLCYPEYPAGYNRKTLVFNIDIGEWSEATGIWTSLFAEQSAISDTCKLLFAHINKSLLFRFGITQTDTGEAIALTLKSKAFSLGDIHKDKRLVYFDMDYYLDADSVNTYFYTDFGDSLRYSSKITTAGGNRHARMPINIDRLGRNFSFKLTSYDKFKLGSISLKFLETGE